jgi:hypothetical protein
MGKLWGMTGFGRCWNEPENPKFQGGNPKHEIRNKFKIQI